jgi:SAM-dependent methyltransferase
MVNSREIARTLTPTPLVDGVWEFWRGIGNIQQAVFERWLGVSTVGHHDLDQVGLADEGRVFYEGSQWIPVHRALRTLRPGLDDVLVDLGSGKGQAVLIAARLPFGRVLGVELVPALSQEARHNIARARPRLRAGEVEVVTADALTWEIPRDLSVVYLYCPFTGDLFHSVMERIFASYDECPRRLHIVYTFPWEHNWLMGSGRVTVQDVLPAEWPPKPWWWRGGWVTVIYRVLGPREGGPSVPRVRRRFLRPAAALERWGSSNDNVFRLMRDGHTARRSDQAE